MAFALRNLSALVVSDRVAAFTIALVARVTIALLAWGRFPPAGDGAYYHRIAARIAEGHGYTWVWPDGAVTYAAHYPVGYPALLGAFYAITGPHPGVAMMLNAFIGAWGVVAVYDLALRIGGVRGARLAALLASMHIALLAYVPAVMTEGITASLLAIGANYLARAGDRESWKAHRSLLAAGVVFGVATLVRPQNAAIALIAAWLFIRQPWRTKAHWLAVFGVAVLAVCGPWAVRNAIRMGHAQLSFNGGWNLLIGSSAESTGAWSPVVVPKECRVVFDEAAKDACFGRAAVRWIAANPTTWLSLMVRKLSVTFDYCGAGGWYLHDSARTLFTYSAKVALGIGETLYVRATLLGAVVAWARCTRGSNWLRWGVAAPVLVGVFARHVVAGVIALALLTILVPPTKGRAVWQMAGSALLVTAVTHAVFFGAGRYSLVVMPLICVLAGAVLTVRRKPRDTSAKGVVRHATDRD